MQRLQLLLVVALLMPAATLEILAKTEHGSNTSTGLKPPEHKHSRRHHHGRHHHAQHEAHEAHHSHVRMVNRGHHEHEVAESSKTVAEDYALSIDFCTRWRLSSSTRAMCNEYMRRRCQTRPRDNRKAGLCATYLSGASETKAGSDVGMSKAKEDANDEATEDAKEETQEDAKEESQEEAKEETKREATEEGAEAEIGPMPAQGYSGQLVAHKDMETHTKDWRKEYGPNSKHPHRTFARVCAKYPDSEWCRQNGYLAEERVPLEQHEEEEGEAEEEEQTEEEPRVEHIKEREEPEVREEREEQQEVEEKEDKELTWWEKVKRKAKVTVVDPSAENVKKAHENMRRHTKRVIESMQGKKGKNSAAFQQAVLTSPLVLWTALAVL